MFSICDHFVPSSNPSEVYQLSPTAPKQRQHEVRALLPFISNTLLFFLSLLDAAVRLGLLFAFCYFVTVFDVSGVQCCVKTWLLVDINSLLQTRLLPKTVVPVDIHLLE